VKTARRLSLLFVAVFVVSVVTHAQPQSPASAVYFPGESWRTATPESQGIDSQALAAAIDQVREKGWGTHSLLVIRHGFVVADADFYPYSSSAPHDLASVTKTITSTLTGVAVANGLVKLDQTVASFFPNDVPADADPRTRTITVGNLLHMESGLDCGFLPGEQELERMKRSDNWVRFALSLPVKYDAGTRPAYCSPGYHLLGSVLGAAAGSNELTFARKYLFDPLRIGNVVWADDPQGRSHGWGDSHFYPRDVAKIGYLYLHGGNWNGKQIVPADWVAASIAPPAGARNEPGGFGIEWNAVNGPNGRQYGGTGRGGQSLIVWPDLDMVVVSMAGGNAGQLTTLVRQAVKGDQPLPANPAGIAALAASRAAAARPPAAAPVTPAPAIAASMSGKVFRFPVNASRIDSLALTFDRSGAARVALEYYGEPFSLPIGLDGVYRVGPYGPFRLPAAATGRWTSDTEFLLDLNFIANINHYTLAIRFTPEDTMDVAVNEASGLMRNGHIVGTPREK
jgi:CubicO group peptidase (beta-lactamase class C family)